MSENGSDRELILGNKQLLAIFFVAALLCGVFFAVGYVVGGNSAKSTIATDSSTTPVAEGKREEPGAITPNSDAGANGGAAASTVSTVSDTPGAAPAPEPMMADNPSAAGSAPPAATTAQSAPAAKPAPPAAAPGPAALSIPESGASYVQIAAQKRPAADDLAKSLRERGWPTILAESSRPDLVEVLVGPYRAPLALADAKRKLTELGFAGLIVHKQQ